MDPEPDPANLTKSGPEPDPAKIVDPVDLYLEKSLNYNLSVRVSYLHSQFEPSVMVRA